MSVESEGPKTPFSELSGDQAHEVANEIKPLEDEAAGLEAKTELLRGAEDALHQDKLDQIRESELKKKGEDPTHLVNLPAERPNREVSGGEAARSELLQNASDIIAVKKAHEVLERDSGN